MASLPSRAETSTQRLQSRPQWDFQLIIREQPVHSRMCGIGERVDRRPIDPPPIVQLKILGQDTEEMMNNLQAVSPYIFLAAVLVPDDVAGDTLDQPLQIDYHRKLTIGRTVSSLYLLRDLDNTEGAFFAFSDISVRADGRYRLRMCLFEMLDSGVQYRQSVLTEGFTVYSAKKFPGMHLSCPLACHFAEQGLKIRIRKESRKRSTGTRWSFETISDGGNEGDSLHPGSDTPKRHSIASRTSEEFSGYSSENVMIEATSRNPDRAGDSFYPFTDDSEVNAVPFNSKHIRTREEAHVVNQSSSAEEHVPKKHLSNTIYSSPVGFYGGSSSTSDETYRRLQVNQSGIISRTSIDSIVDVISTTHQIEVDDTSDYQQQSACQQANVHKEAYLKLPPLQSSILTVGKQDQEHDLQPFHRPSSKASHYDDQQNNLMSAQYPASSSSSTPSSSRGNQYPNTTFLPVERAATIPTTQLEWRPDRPELVIQSSRRHSILDQQNTTVLPPLREQLERIGVQSSATEDDNTDQGYQAGFTSQR